MFVYQGEIVKAALSGSNCPTMEDGFYNAFRSKFGMFSYEVYHINCLISVYPRLTQLRS